MSSFIAPNGVRWRIYHVDRRMRPDLFEVDLAGNAKAIGLTHFRGPYRHKIFIDARRPARLKFETTLHEIMHVVLRHLGLKDVIEEVFVDEFAAHVSAILEQL